MNMCVQCVRKKWYAKYECTEYMCTLTKLQSRPKADTQDSDKIRENQTKGMQLKKKTHMYITTTLQLMHTDRGDP